MNHSPWLHQLERTRPVYRLDRPRGEDLVIVGGGIAGITTAAFALLGTKRSVTLLEATKVAHGATGHNAGQIVSYFERPPAELARIFGDKLLADGLRAVASGWDLLARLQERLDLRTPVISCSGYAGLIELSGVRAFLRNAHWRAAHGLPMQPLYVAEEAWERLRLPARDQALVTRLPRERLLALLETPDPRFIAVEAERKGVTNSAALCEEIASVLLARFPERFSLHEETPVKEIAFGPRPRIVAAAGHVIQAKDVVLCTNGFESFRLIGASGADLDRRFHAAVEGKIGYMAGYLAPPGPPTAVSYLEHGYEKNDAYVYMTRRPHGDTQTLVCWGGPDKDLPERERYFRHIPMAPEKERELRQAVARLHPAERKKAFQYRWHGLMGYTRHGVRLIGRDPREPHLFYNLGCNGVGILPSIYGGFRLAEIFQGKKLGKSMFDP